MKSGMTNEDKEVQLTFAKLEDAYETIRSAPLSEQLKYQVLELISEDIERMKKVRK